MERKSIEDRNGGLPGKAGFNGIDESDDRKISPLALHKHDSIPLSLVGFATDGSFNSKRNLGTSERPAKQHATRSKEYGLGKVNGERTYIVID